MPLIKSGSKKAMPENIKHEMHAGKPQKQAIAIAYSVMRRNKKKYADGGMVENEELNPQHEPGMGPQTSIQRDSILKPKDDNLKEMYDQDREESMSASPEMENMPHGMLGMDYKTIVDNLRKYADGGPVLDPNKAQSAQDSLRKAFHFAEGGEALGDSHINSDYKEDDFLSQDSDPMPEDLSHGSNEIGDTELPEEDQKDPSRILKSIMARLHSKHYGK